MDVKSIWNSLRKAESTPDLEKRLQKYSERRDELDKSLEQHHSSKAQIFSDSGPEGLSAHLQQIRAIENEIVICDTAIADDKKQLEKFRARESAEKLDALKKQVDIDVGDLYEFDVEFINTCSKLIDIEQQYLLKKQNVTNFIQVAAKAGRSDLKPPANPISLAFAVRGLPWTKPIEDQALIQALRNAANQKLLLKKLGVEI